MSKVDEELMRSLRLLFKAPIQTFPAVVVEDSIDLDQLTCTVQPIDGAEIPEVRLKAAVNGRKSGLVEIPVEGTSVLCGLIGNDDNTCFVLLIDEVDYCMFNDGSKGGLINIQTLITNLNKTNEVVNVIKDALTNWPITPSDGGAALKTYFASHITGKAVGDFTAMEDTKVRH